MLLLAALLLPLASFAAEPVRVGVYQNRPGVFIEPDGSVRGFYIDILEHAAEAEGWVLDYVPDTWPALLHQLREGEIDLIVGIAYTAERDEIYDFTRETVFANWGQVYVKGAGIESLFDLRGAVIAGLKDDIYTNSFRALLGRFDIPATFTEVDEYAKVLEAVDAGLADAGIISRSNGKRLESRYSVHRSPIVCCAKEIRYATLEGWNGQVLDGLDRHMRALKAENGSVYYQALDRWFGDHGRSGIPRWVWWVVALLSGGVAVVFGGNLLLRRQVRLRTAELQEAHDLLETRVTERTAELSATNVKLHREIEDHTRTQEKLQHLARHDALTGLPNRRWFAEHLAEDIKRARRDRTPLAVLFLDLDGFKAINDSLGHDRGDRVLIEAAARIRRCLREADQLARLGGDEFIVVLPEIASPADGRVVADKILAAMGEPFEIDGHTPHLGVSIGISLFPEHGEDAETLLRKADTAMYASKKAGRGTVTECQD